MHGDKVAVDALLEHPDIDAVSFVGSTPIARYVHEGASRTGKRVQALGGAKNHAVVMPDADLDFAADHLVAAGYGSAGQRCMAISAVVAVGPAADTLVDKVREPHPSTSRSAPAPSPASTWVRSSRRPRATASSTTSSRVNRQAPRSSSTAATVRASRAPTARDGFFVGPTLIDHVTTDMSVYTEEIFGPVLTVLRVDTLEEALAVVNANPYGNGTAVFTSSGEVARTFQRQVTVGMIGINVPSRCRWPSTPSAAGRTRSSATTTSTAPKASGFYTRAKVVTSRWPHVSEESLAQLNFPTAH